MKRIVLIAALFFGLTVSVFVAVRLASPKPHAINDKSFERIALGMKVQEVEAIFGVPPGDYTTKRISFVFPPTSGYSLCLYGNSTQVWSSNEGQFRIRFDHNHRVVGRIQSVGFSVEESWFEKLKRLVRLP